MFDERNFCFRPFRRSRFARATTTPLDSPPLFFLLFFNCPHAERRGARRRVRAVPSKSTHAWPLSLYLHTRCLRSDAPRGSPRRRGHRRRRRKRRRRSEKTLRRRPPPPPPPPPLGRRNPAAASPTTSSAAPWAPRPCSSAFPPSATGSSRRATRGAAPSTRGPGARRSSLSPEREGGN